MTDTHIQDLESQEPLVQKKAKRGVSMVPKRQNNRKGGVQPNTADPSKSIKLLFHNELLD